MKDLVSVCNYKKDVNKDEMTNVTIVTENISTKRKMSFIQFVVDNILDDGNYNLVLKDIIIDVGLIRYFSDVDISDILSAEDFIDEFEKFRDNTDLIDVIKSEMDNNELANILNCINKQIEYKTGIHDDTITTALSNLIKTIDRKIGNIDLDITNLNKILSIMPEEFTMDNLVKAYSDNILQK